MEWYHLFSLQVEKKIGLAVLLIVFALILHRKINIAYISLIGAGLLISLGAISPGFALSTGVEWKVLAIYWGYGMLAFAFRESRLPAWLGQLILRRVRKEKYVLILLCALAAFLSSFMANSVVVIILAPLVIHIAERLKADLFLYLVGLAIASNVVTTVTMVADPPALILASKTGMTFLDFYWFQGKMGLGTISVFGVTVALLILLFQFWHLNKVVDVDEEDRVVITSHVPLVIFIVSVIALSLPVPIPFWAGYIGLFVGLSSLAFGRKHWKGIFSEFDWNSIFFLIGVFILITTVEKIGLLKDFADWLSGTGLKSRTLYMAIFVWLSVLLSSFIDNVPYTIVMIPVCTFVAQSLGVNPYPFYFGMLVGTGIGGNITPVGATANVLACGILEQRGYKIDLPRYLKISVPFSVGAVFVAHLLLEFLWV